MDRLAFLDFDGVLCDSVLECLVSSWKAFYEEMRPGPPPRSVPLTVRDRFRQMRPYARTGEDYVLIQELIAAGSEVSSQQDFDAQLRSRGAETMREYERLFYQARGELLRTARPYWVALNRMYAFLAPHLGSWARSPCFYIISTKQASYTLEILAAWGVAIEPSRVLSCRAAEKYGLIVETSGRLAARQALWVEDQIDYLRPRPAGDGQVDVLPCLATWGYLSSEAPRQAAEANSRLRPLTPAGLVDTLSGWLCPAPSS